MVLISPLADSGVEQPCFIRLSASTGFIGNPDYSAPYSALYYGRVISSRFETRVLVIFDEGKAGVIISY